MRVAFKIPDVDEINEVAGFLYLDEGFLVFEFRLLEWGVMPGDPTIVKVEPGVIDGIRVRRRLFGDRLLIATHNLQLLQGIPGPHTAEIVLRTKRRHRAEVDQFVDRVRRWKAEQMP